MANLKARATAAAFALLVLAPTLAAAETPANPAFRTAEDQPDFPASGPVRWVSSELQITYRDGAQSRVELDALTKAANVWSAVACADVTLNVTEPPFADVLVERIRNWSARGLDEEALATTDLSYRTIGQGRDERWVIGGATVLLNVERIESRGVSLEAVLTHELGHVLGLLHPCEFDDAGAPRCNATYEGSALYPEHRDSQVMLSASDADGLCYLYPEPVEPTCDEVCREGCGIECAALGDPCGDGLASCSAGTCAADGFCSLPCNTNIDCGSRGECRSGACEPARAARFGESCRSGNDCESLLCVTDDGSSQCTRSCTDQACPSDYRCSEVDGRSVCRRPTSGCSAGGPPTSLAFALVAFALRRRSAKRANN
ncbi:MAG: matrixin family metalloprotease [Myxococcota bacterium]